VQLSALITASSLGSFLRGPAFAMVLMIGWRSVWTLARDSGLDSFRLFCSGQRTGDRDLSYGSRRRRAVQIGLPMPAPIGPSGSPSSGPCSPNSPADGQADAVIVQSSPPVGDLFGRESNVVHDPREHQELEMPIRRCLCKREMRMEYTLELRLTM
jgi:hypothetical protein